MTTPKVEHAPDFVWHSTTPWLPTAFGQQTGMVLESLNEAGYSFVLSSPDPAPGDLSHATHRHAPQLSGRQLATNSRDSFAGTSSRPRAIAFVNVERILDDPCPDVDLALWLPFNFSPPPRRLRSYISARGATRVLALTRWAIGALADCGISSTYIPHCVDRETFAPSRSRGLEMRRRLGMHSDHFVVGVVASNNEWFGNRKSLPEILAAFSTFARNQPKAVLYLHTDVTGQMDGGIDVLTVAEQLELPIEQLRFTDPLDFEQGWSRDDVADLYRAMDVLMAPSAGEGFGVPLIEAQACGVPVIASNWAAQQELVGVGCTVGGQPRWAPWADAWQFTPNIAELVAALEATADTSHRCQLDAVRFTDQYDLRTVTSDHWIPFLDGWLGPHGAKP